MLPSKAHPEMCQSRPRASSSPHSALTRRDFLKRALLAGGAVAVPSLIPASALGLNGTVPPSERIVLGGLGVGGRGTGVLNWMLPEKDVQFVAICDAKKSQREAIKRLVDSKYGNKDCAMYRDMREFLAARTDIDALLIATGDRWHATASVLAMRAGKDVYSEKPSSMTIAEGQAVVATAPATDASIRPASSGSAKTTSPSPTSSSAPGGSARCTPSALTSHRGMRQR